MYAKSVGSTLTIGSKTTTPGTPSTIGSSPAMRLRRKPSPPRLASDGSASDAGPHVGPAGTSPQLPVFHFSRPSYSSSFGPEGFLSRFSYLEESIREEGSLQRNPLTLERDTTIRVQSDDAPAPLSLDCDNAHIIAAVDAHEIDVVEDQVKPAARSSQPSGMPKRKSLNGLFAPPRRVDSQEASTTFGDDSGWSVDTFGRPTLPEGACDTSAAGKALLRGVAKINQTRE